MIASMMMSQSTRSSNEVVPNKRSRVCLCCSALIVPFAANRSKDFSIEAKPFCSSSSETSRTVVSKPALAAVWAMPEPIRPQPSTPTFFNSILNSSNQIDPQVKQTTHVEVGTTHVSGWIEHLLSQVERMDPPADADLISGIDNSLHSYIVGVGCGRWTPNCLPSLQNQLSELVCHFLKSSISFRCSTTPSGVIRRGGRHSLRYFPARPSSDLSSARMPSV